MASRSVLELSEANFQSSPLLRLPQELIDLIINLVVMPILSRSPSRPRQPQTRPARPRSEQRARAPLIKKLMPIMRICRKPRADSGKIIYSRDYEYWNEHDRPLKDWIEDIAGEYRCHIRKMRNAMVSAGSMEDARLKAAELDREHGFRKGTFWVLSYLPHENQQSGFEQSWINPRGKKELFEPVEFIYGPGIIMDKTGYSNKALYI